MSFELGDYVDVAARLAEFREKHPEGSLQPADVSRPYEVVEIGGQTWITVVAAAYRTPDDQRPGIGMAYEQYPGRTPYTKGSELQNAETSAWGRAIVAALAADTRRGGIASKDDVRNRRAEQEQPGPTEDELVELRARALPLRDEALQATTKDELSAVWKKAGPALLAVEIPNENNDEEQLGALIKRRGNDLPAAGSAPEGEQSDG